MEEKVKHLENLLESAFRKSANYKAKLMMMKKLKDENKIKIDRDGSESERRSIRIDLNDIFMDNLNETQTINDLKNEIVSLKAKQSGIDNLSCLSNRTSQQSQIIVLNEAIKAIRRKYHRVKLEKDEYVKENASLRQVIVKKEREKRDSIESYRSSLSRGCLQKDEEIESLNKRIGRMKVKNDRISFEKAHKVEIIEMNVDKIETLNGMIKQMHIKRNEYLEQIDLLKDKLQEQSQGVRIENEEMKQLRDENDKMKQKLVEHNALLLKCDELEQYKRASIEKLRKFEQYKEENLDKMKQEIKKKNVQLNELSALNEANEEKIRFSKKVMQQMDNELNQKNVEIASLHQSISDLKIKFDAVLLERNDLTKELKAKEAQDDQDELIHKIQTKYDDALNEIESLKNMQQKEDEQRHNILGMTSRFFAESQEIKEQIKQKQEEIIKMKTKNPIQEYVKEIERLNDEKKRMDETNKVLQKEIETIKKFKYDKKQIRLIKNENNALKIKNKALLIENEDLMKLMNAQNKW